jgi:exopolysaccharide production protein ExoQ
MIEPALSEAQFRQAPPIQWMLSLCMLLWIVYMASNFRSPPSPILLSDENSGAAFRQLIFGGAGLLAISLLFFNRRIGDILTFNLPITALTGFVVLSALWSDIPALTLKRAVLFIFCHLAVSTYVLQSEQPCKDFLRKIVITTTGIALVSLVVYTIFPKEYSVNPARPGLAGISVHPNTLAPFLSIGLLLSFGLDTSKGAIRIFAARAILITALLLTGSMTTIMTTLLGFGVFLLLSSGKYRKGILQLLLFTALALLALIGWSNIRAEVFDATGRDESLSGRDVLWEIVINEGKAHTIFGKGFGAFWTEGKGRELVQTWNPRQSHNAYLDVWLDLGILGIAGVLFCFPFALYKRWHAVRGDEHNLQRKCMAALYSTAISYMLIYAFAQSFFLRFDSFPFLIVAWITLIVVNTGQNRIETEFTLSPTGT